MVKIGDLLVRSRVTLHFLNGCQTLELGQASTVHMLPSCTRFISYSDGPITCFSVYFNPCKIFHPW